MRNYKTLCWKPTNLHLFSIETSTHICIWQTNPAMIKCIAVFLYLINLTMQKNVYRQAVKFKTQLCVGLNLNGYKIIIIKIMPTTVDIMFPFQGRLEKRIFCNFDGCHNKRSDGTSTEKLISSLLSSSSKDGNDYVMDTDQSAPENMMVDDKLFAANWQKLSSAPSGELSINPNVLRALIRRLNEQDKRRKRNASFWGDVSIYN